MKPKVYIYVEGGVIQSILADQPVDLLVLDGDIDGLEDGEYKEWKDLRDHTFEARRAWAEAEVSKKAALHFFNQDDRQSSTVFDLAGHNEAFTQQVS